MVVAEEALEEEQGVKPKYDKPFNERISRINIEKSVYQRWCALRQRLGFRCSTDVAKYLLNLADTFEAHPFRGYVQDACM